VRLWIADSGALDEPIGPSPLVTDPTMKADYRTGRAPWGQSLRGDSSTVSLFQRHILVAGISNQGKTASLRALILWLALDRRVRLWIADLKGVGDWGMFKGIAEVLIEGPADAQVMAATHMVEAAVVEMEKRTDLMRELTEKGWSQEKILADPRFAPLVVLIDEAQKAYGSSAIGEDGRPYGGMKNTSRYFQGVKAIHDQGRAVNVTTAEGVQDPTDQNLPKRSREGNHIRASLVVGTEAQGAMALGENAVNAGAAPHELRQGADKGTVVVAGDITAYDMPQGQVYTTIRTHYIGPEDAAVIADRARALRKAVETKGAAAEPEKRDVLADVAEVLGADDRVRTEEVVHRLKSLAPDFYRAWTTSELTAALRGTGAEPYKTIGTMHVGLSRVREALEARENESADAETDASEA
jgi:S-DNA-T family DNA segregation ATPase FtsK/SpoIIIE